MVMTCQKNKHSQAHIAVKISSNVYNCTALFNLPEDKVKKFNISDSKTSIMHVFLTEREKKSKLLFSKQLVNFKSII